MSIRSLILSLHILVTHISPYKVTSFGKVDAFTEQCKSGYSKLVCVAMRLQNNVSRGTVTLNSAYCGPRCSDGFESRYEDWQASCDAASTDCSDEEGKAVMLNDV